jgi:hypothetical protein
MGFLDSDLSYYKRFFCKRHTAKGIRAVSTERSDTIEENFPPWGVRMGKESSLDFNSSSKKITRIIPGIQSGSAVQAKTEL